MTEEIANHFETDEEIEKRKLGRCLAIAFAQKRFLGKPLKRTLYQLSLNEDLNQELFLAALEARRLRYNEKNFKAIKNLAQRRIYAFLKANGFYIRWNPITKTHGKGWVKREVQYSRRVQKRV